MLQEPHDSGLCAHSVYVHTRCLGKSEVYSMDKPAHYCTAFEVFHICVMATAKLFLCGVNKVCVYVTYHIE